MHLVIRASISMATAWAGGFVVLLLVNDLLWSAMDEQALIVGIVFWAVLSVGLTLLLLLERPVVYAVHAALAVACAGVAAVVAWRDGWGEPTITAAHVSIACAWTLVWSTVLFRRGAGLARTR